MPEEKHKTLMARQWLPSILLLFFWAALAGCAAQDRRIADLAELPQAASWYQARAAGAGWSVKPAFQAGLLREWRRQWFSPWLKPDAQAGAARIKADGEEFLEKPGVGENLLARQEPYYWAMIKNCQWEKYPNAGWRAISLAGVHLRLLPSERPVFSSEKPGEGFPFDRLQQTSLPPNTPLFVHHVTEDKAWCLAQTPLAWGWLPMGLVAAMADEQIQQWMTPELMAVTGEEADVETLTGRHLFKASLGAVLPWAGQEGEHCLALAAVADHRGRAVILSAKLDKKQGVKMPLSLEARQVAALADKLMGQPYGWGGMFGQRDCSATMRDLFTPFGLWLPRNSTDQAKEGGRFISLAGLDGREKKLALQREGVPFLTLVWLPGHIMLYMGDWRGEPLVLHNAWGLRTAGGGLIIGRAVITTLEPGKEREDLTRPEGLLLNRVEGFTLLAPAQALRRGDAS